MSRPAPIQADISQFEALQAQANVSMGVSGLGVFNSAPVQNVSSNVKGILIRLPKFKVHWDGMERQQENIKKLQSDKTARPANAAGYDSIISDYQRRSQGYKDYMATEAKNIAALIDLERKRLDFHYKPGAPVSKDGVEPAVYTERKEFADAVNAFYAGKLPDGTPYSSFLK